MNEKRVHTVRDAHEAIGGSSKLRESKSSHQPAAAATTTAATKQTEKRSTHRAKEAETQSDTCVYGYNEQRKKKTQQTI